MRKLFIPAVLAAMMAPGAAYAAECVVGLSLTEGRANYDNSLTGNGTRMVPVGTWQADRGGAWRDANTKFNQDWVSLSAQMADMASGQCLTELTTYHANWGSPVTIRGNQQLLGTWDVEGGGSGNSAGNPTGDGLFSVGYVRMARGSTPANVITGIELRISSGRNTITSPGFGWVGHWDVRDGTGSDGVSNSYMATLSWRAEPYVAPPISQPVVTGAWEMIASCTSVSRCAALRTNTQVGSATDVTQATINTQTKEVSVMVGAEIETDSGKLLPGVVARAKLEVTGTFGEENSQQLSKSIQNNEVDTVEVECQGQSSAWLWVSSINFGSRPGASRISIRDRNYVCAGPDETPGKLSGDYSWGRNFSSEEWTRVAGEGGTFELKRPALIRYGVGNQSTVRSLPAGTYTCGTALWGGYDPLVYTVKQCERPKEWERCASDGQTCNWGGEGGQAVARRVRFGNKPNYVYLDSAASGFVCQQSTFGGTDPAPGQKKFCSYKVQ